MIFDVVTNKLFKDLLAGTVPAGDSKKLNGLTAEEFVSNDNLLINADFRNPVNSSGKTSWTGKCNIFDMWSVNYNTTVTVNDGYITIKGDNNISQVDSFESGTYTLSFKARSTDGATMYASVKDKNTNQISLTTEWAVYTFTVTLTDAFTTVNFLMGTASRGKGLSFDLEWAKLELGSVATPFIPPNKEVEMVKCGVKTKGTLTTLPTPPTEEGDYRVESGNGTFPYAYGNAMLRRGVGSAEYSILFESSGDNNRVYYNVYRQGGWVDWRDISDGGNADTVDGLHASDFPIIKSARNVTVVDGNHQYIRLNVDNTVPDLPTSNYTHFITTYESGGVVSAVSIGRDYVSDIFSYSEKDKTWHKLGRASDFLPLDGSVPMSGRLYVGSGYGIVAADESSALLMTLNTADDRTAGRQLILGNSKSKTIDKCLYLFDRVNNVNTEYTVLHTGNSQKVTITDSADDVPSEMSGLWAY